MNTIILFFLSVIAGYGYLEMKLVRIPHGSNVYNYGKVQCLTDIPSNREKKKSNSQDTEDGEDEDDEDQDGQVSDNDNFKQICYEKDISYAVQLFDQKTQMMLMSVDLTAPISWLKGQKCRITQTHSKCTRVERSFRSEVTEIEQKFQNILKGSWRHPKRTNQAQYAIIEGSSEVVKGIMEKTKTLTFQTRNTGHLTRFFDVLMLGLAIIGQYDNFTLQNTSFINATQISPNLNFLCDGAISLRFDESSQSSFLLQMAALARTRDKYVTIFIGANNQTMTIGDLSVKNSVQGLSSITWVDVHETDYGKLPSLSQISLTYSQSEKKKVISCSLQAVLTLSSSAIHIPKKQLEQIMKKFLHGANCSVNQESRYLECKNIKSSDMQSGQLNFALQSVNIMLSLNDLVLEKKSSHSYVFHIKQALEDRFIILGEPVFKKYFVVLDYQNDRIGLSLQRTKFITKVIDVVTLIRIVVWFFLLACCIILISNPIERCWKILNTRDIAPHGGFAIPIQRAKKYRALRETPNEEIKIQEQISQDDEAQGI